jgi:uncharacterized protein
VIGWLVFGLVFVATGALLIAFAAWVIALSLLHPPRMTDAKALYVLRRMSPADVGLPFEPVEFDVSGIKLASWWIPAAAPSARCVVFLHGYADARVGAIAWAPLWHTMGWNILAIDLRAHGESGGRHTTGGYFERNDVAGAIEQLRQRLPNQSRTIVLFGISLGGAVALGMAAIRPDLVNGIVLECPFASFTNAATSHAARMGSPRGLIMPLALWMAEKLSGARFDESTPVKLLEQISLPIFVIQSADDSFVAPDDAAAIEAVAQRRAKVTYWKVPNAEHLLALAAQPQEYAARLAEFLHHV